MKHDCSRWVLARNVDHTRRDGLLHTTGKAYQNNKLTQIDKEAKKKQVITPLMKRTY